MMVMIIIVVKLFIFIVFIELNSNLIIFWLNLLVNEMKIVFKVILVFIIIGIVIFW